MSLKEDIINHPKNEHISFEKDTHTYTYKSNKIFNGVTSWISQYKEKFDAEAQAKKSNKNPYSKWYDMGEDEILRTWREIGNEANKYGNFVHDVIEGFVNGVYELPYKELDKFKTFIKQENLTPICSEWVIYDESIERASAVDLVFEKNDEIVIYDLKTMEKPIPYKAYGDKKMYEPLDHLPDSKYYKQALQVNIYKYWLKHLYNVNVSHTNYILRLRDNVCEKIPVLDLQDEIKLLYDD